MLKGKEEIEGRERRRTGYERTRSRRTVGRRASLELQSHDAQAESKAVAPLPKQNVYRFLH